jgi:hypothetical protein
VVPAAFPGGRETEQQDVGVRPSAVWDGRPAQQPGEALPAARAVRDDTGRQPPSPKTARPANPEGVGTGPESTAPDERPKLDASELRERLAAIREVSFELKSADRNPKSKLNMLIKQQAVQAAERAGLEVIKDGAVVMQLTLETPSEDGFVGFVMSAELTCREPEADVIKVWEHKKQVASISTRALRRPTLPMPIRTGVGDFFDRFVKDCREARGEGDPGKARTPD